MVRLGFNGDLKVPLKFINQLGLSPGDELDISIRGGRNLVIRKKNQCIYCGTNKNIRNIGNLKCCENCGKTLGLIN